MRFTYLFTRQEGLGGISNAAYLILEGLGSLGTGHQDGPQGETLMRFKLAVTQWINTTEQGKRSYADSCEDFNIGDFLNDGVRTDDDFGRICQQHNVRVVHCEQLPLDQHCSFDALLYDQDAVDEWWDRYARMVRFYEEHENMDTSDAQGAADVSMGQPPGPRSDA